VLRFQLSITPRRRVGAWRYSSSHSLTSALDGASRPGRFIPRPRPPGIHWIGGWVGLRAVLDAKSQIWFVTDMVQEVRKVVGSHIFSCYLPLWCRLMIALCIKWLSSNKKVADVNRFMHYKTVRNGNGHRCLYNYKTGYGRLRVRVQRKLKAWHVKGSELKIEPGSSSAHHAKHTTKMWDTFPIAERVVNH